MKLVKYQKDVIREIFNRDENGNFKYSIIVWSDIKKSAKSTIAAAINLYGVEFFSWHEHYVIANDLKQADSRVAHYIRRAIQLNPNLSKKYKINGYRVIAPNGSFIEAIPIDPSGEAGGNADMITWSELWGSNEKAKEEMWVEQTLPPGKYGKAFRFVESYAGFMEESKLLYSLYDLGVKQGQLLWPDRLYDVTDGTPTPLELYVNKEAGMLCLWNTQPRCPWQNRAYYQSEEKILPNNQFRRIHRNQWVSSEESFIPMEWFWACQRKQDDWPTIDVKKHNMIIAMDAGVSDDNFGIVMFCRHPDKKDEVLLMFAQKWVPPLGGKIDFVGTEEKPGPEIVLRRLIKEYNVIEITYDEYQLHSMATRLKQEGLGWFKPFSQGNDRLVADSQYRDMIRDRRIWHRGEHDVAEHMSNANAQIDAEERKIRIVKRTEKLKIDLTVAGSMCVHEVMRLNL
jgi:phage terminase large subunit-like protein